MQDPGSPSGRVIAVRAVGGSSRDAGAQWLERGRLNVSIVIDGLPICELPTGARLRLGAATIVEVAAPSAVSEVGAIPPGNWAAGLHEAGGGDPVTAEVVEAGPVEAGDCVVLEAVALPLTDVLDLHSFLPQDTPRVVRAYLDEARRAGLAEVRIVHGRGHGVQRAMVRRVLSRTPGVAGFADAPPTRGGWGATVVRLCGVEDAPSA